MHSRYILGVALLNNQSDAGVRRALTRIFRRFGLPKVIRVDNGAPFGGNGALGLSRLSVWWLRLGITVEFIRPAHPQDNGARTNKCIGSSKPVWRLPLRKSGQAQKRRVRAWIGWYNHERPARSFGPASAGADLLAEFSTDAISTRRAEISSWLESAAGAQSWAYQMARASALCWTSLCRRVGRTEQNERWHPRSLSRAAIDWVALRARCEWDATGFYCPFDSRSRACPPPLNQRVGFGARLNKRRLRRPAIWLVCSDALQTSPEQKCHPCYEIKLSPMS